MNGIRKHDYSKYCYIPRTFNCDWEYITPGEAAEMDMYPLSYWTKKRLTSVLRKKFPNKAEEIEALNKSILQRAFLLRCNGWFMEDGTDRDDRGIAFFRFRKKVKGKDITLATKIYKKEKDSNRTRRNST